MILWHRVSLAGAALLALPLTAGAHGGEFLVAKAAVRDGGRLRLEVTADYGDNPMIGSEEEAAAAVRGALRLAGGTPLPEPRLERRSQPDPDSPLPPDPLTAGQPHRLLTGVWDLAPAAGPVRLEVPRASGQSVILWTRDEAHPREPARWAMLVPGEQSPSIHLPPATSWRRLSWVGALPFLGLAGYFLATRRKRTRASLGAAA